MADIQHANETLTLFFIFTQETAIALSMNLAWPPILIEIWGWFAQLFNFQISLAGPECFGSWGYAEQWGINVSAPFILIAVHFVVYM